MSSGGSSARVEELPITAKFIDAPLTTLRSRGEYKRTLAMTRYDTHAITMVSSTRLTTLASECAPGEIARVRCGRVPRGRVRVFGHRNAAGGHQVVRIRHGIRSALIANLEPVDPCTPGGELRATTRAGAPARSPCWRAFATSRKRIRAGMNPAVAVTCTPDDFRGRSPRWASSFSRQSRGRTTQHRRTTSRFSRSPMAQSSSREQASRRFWG